MQGAIERALNAEQDRRGRGTMIRQGGQAADRAWDGDDSPPLFISRAAYCRTFPHLPAQNRTFPHMKVGGGCGEGGGRVPGWCARAPEGARPAWGGVFLHGNLVGGGASERHFEGVKRFRRKSIPAPARANSNV